MTEFKNIARLRKQIEKDTPPAKLEDMHQIRKLKANLRTLDPDDEGDRLSIDGINRDVAALRDKHGMAADGADDLPWD
ncbi:hypothetical protein [Rhodococcus sp. BS-15]|uniref:hypothetical protein n=1 Tax=Rhodococcus sp. BS-15 TaxID=1304954 RepID=UPI000AE145D2|nr:hypothetical protein [Rhodococcus sp. BS-15]